MGLSVDDVGDAVGSLVNLFRLFLWVVVLDTVWLGLGMGAGFTLSLWVVRASMGVSGSIQSARTTTELYMSITSVSVRATTTIP